MTQAFLSGSRIRPAVPAWSSLSLRSVMSFSRQFVCFNVFFKSFVCLVFNTETSFCDELPKEETKWQSNAPQSSYTITLNTLQNNTGMLSLAHFPRSITNTYSYKYFMPFTHWELDSVNIATATSCKIIPERMVEAVMALHVNSRTRVKAITIMIIILFVHKYGTSNRK